MITTTKKCKKCEKEFETLKSSFCKDCQKEKKRILDKAWVAKNKQPKAEVLKVETLEKENTLEPMQKPI